jgi:predicted enzyme related to lactoylglutathione lyase
MPTPIAAVMIHVSDVGQALAWYQQAFPMAVRETIKSHSFQFLSCGGIRIEVVQADQKVQSGAAGSVVYWSVANFQSVLDHFLSIGATLYRGPLAIENGQSMCQVLDPWGNCIGLRGPLNE